MAYRVKTYTLREEAAENGTRYFISFKDGQGGYHELEQAQADRDEHSADGTQKP